MSTPALTPSASPRRPRLMSNLPPLLMKEFESLRRDTVLMVLVFYAFSAAILIQANGMKHDLHRATVAVVDEDRSQLSHAITDALLPPRFQTPVAVAPGDLDRAMNQARYVFALDFPPRFEQDVLAGRSPDVQLLIDATALMQAGLGATDIANIFQQEVLRFATRSDKPVSYNPTLEVRAAFNQALESSWFTGTMGLITNITMLSVLLAGAALVREREHGTLEHLLVLPVRPVEVMLAKILANGAVILVLTGLSVLVVLRGILGMTIAGSVPLFMAGVALYLFFTASLGIFLGTVVRSMPQLGLMFMLIVLPMNMLSGGFTPLESMPVALQYIMQVSPSTQFVAFAQAILYRGAGFDVVWPRFLATAAVGLVFFSYSLVRFRGFLAAQQ